jgi:hypothetical protein
MDVPVTKTPLPDDDRRWWIEKVIVPLVVAVLGGGGIVAVWISVREHPPVQNQPTSPVLSAPSQTNQSVGSSPSSDVKPAQADVPVDAQRGNEKVEQLGEAKDAPHPSPIESRELADLAKSDGAFDGPDIYTLVMPAQGYGIFSNIRKSTN